MAMKFSPEHIKEIQTVVGATVDGEFGPETKAHVKLWEKVHGLADTEGEVDAATWAELHAAFMALPATGTNALRGEVVRLARSYIGVREQPLGSNCGPEVDKFNKIAGTARGSYWCLSFAYAVVALAAQNLRQAVPVLQSAYCPGLLAWAEQHGRITTDPKPGDIGLVKSGDAYRVQHAVLVDHVAGQLVQTVEGNSNDNGSSNGIGVFSLTRKKETMFYVSLG